MAKFPIDCPQSRVLRALGALGFEVIRLGNHIALSRSEADGTRTPLTLPGHKVIKSSTLRAALTQSGIGRDEFIREYEKA
jgi:predicted RNA binding protein YcfA (HicA-like mRNA interferase family)